MYQVDDRDRAVELEGLPQSETGAPIPFIVSDEHTLAIAYCLQERPRNWDGRTIRVVGPETPNMPIALVRFKNYTAFMFGPPNDEAFSGHPLASRGLHPYGCFEVLDSSWIRTLERMNSIHPYHDPGRYQELKHYVFSFHDSTFECIAPEFELSTDRGSIVSVVPKMLEMLKRE